MTSTYIAGRYSRKDELRECANELQDLGINVTSRWLQEKHDPNVQMKEIKDAELLDIALIDLADINAADSFVFFAEDQNKQPPRGGRHVEFGYALACNKDIHVIGAEENLFHYLPSVKVHSSWESFVGLAKAPVLV